MVTSTGREQSRQNAAIPDRRIVNRTSTARVEENGNSRNDHHEEVFLASVNRPSRRSVLGKLALPFLDFGDPPIIKTSNHLRIKLQWLRDTTSTNWYERKREGPHRAWGHEARNSPF
jgi:hypothetical protein